MFGNLKGWIIAAVVLLAQIAGVVWLLGLDNISPPTELGRNPENLKAFALPFDPRPLVPATVQQDAGTLYRQAIRVANDNKFPYERFAQRPDPDLLPQLDAFRFLIDARYMAKATLFSNDLDSIIKYNQPDRQDLVMLDNLGKGLLNAGTLKMNDQPEEAKKYFEAAFNLGYHMVNERIVFQQVQVGMGLLSTAADGLAALPGANASQFEQFRTTRGQYFTDRVMPIWGVLTAIDNNKIGKHAGDYFAFAKNSQEPMFRVEAILALGRMRFNAGTGGRAGDQQGASRILNEIVNSTSATPAEKKAAQLALDLTAEQFRTIQ
jgi:hypothetical protein